MLESLKRHYEKVICACCFLILFTNIGLPSTSFSVYQPYLVELPGVGHTGGSVIISVRTFVSLIAMFFVARYYHALDCRRGVFFSSVSVAIGFALYSFAGSNYALLCVGSAFTGLGYGMGGMVASTMLIERWFASHAATAVGIAAVGSGVAAVILPPIVVMVIDATSLSTAFFFEAILAFAVGVLVFLLLRNRPADMGLEAYVDPKEQAKGKRRSSRRSRNLPHSWLPVVFLAMAIVGSISVGGTSYLAVLFTSEGFSTEEAAALVAVCGGCLTVSKLFSGIVFDKAGTRNGSVAFFAVLIIGIVLLCISDLGLPSIALIAVVLYGFGVTLGTVGISIWSMELAPQGHEVQTIKNFQICYALGGFVFTFLPGFLMEAFGTYLVTYTALLVMGIAAAAAIVIIYTVLDRRALKADRAAAQVE